MGRSASQQQWQHRILGASKSDDGFSIISVVIAFSLFVAVLGPAALLLQQATSVSGEVQNRIIAANLATKQLELIHAQADYGFGSLVSNYLGTSSTTVPIGGIDFTISQTLAWTPGSYSPGGCGSTANGNTSLQAVLSATTSVRWTTMSASETPVSESTTFTPPIGQYSASSGDIAIQVLSASGTGQPNISVTEVGPSGGTTTSSTADTDANGCVFFPFLAPGSYTVSLSSPSGYNYVDPLGNSSPSTTLGVTTGTISTYQFSYDQAATLAIPAPQSGYTTPSDLGVTLSSSKLPGLGTIILNPIPSPNGGGQVVIPNLFPFPSGYDVWLGSCYTYQVGSTFSSVSSSAVTAGATMTAQLAQYPAQVEVLYQGAPVAGATVSVTMMDASSPQSPPYSQSCPANTSDTIPLIAQTTASSQNVNVPVGYVQFSASAVINGVSVSGTYPPSTNSPPYIDTTAGTGGPIVITVS